MSVSNCSFLCPNHGSPQQKLKLNVCGCLFWSLESNIKNMVLNCCHGCGCGCCDWGYYGCCDAFCKGKWVLSFDEILEEMWAKLSDAVSKMKGGVISNYTAIAIQCGWGDHCISNMTAVIAVADRNLKPWLRRSFAIWCDRVIYHISNITAVIAVADRNLKPEETFHSVLLHH